MPLLQERLSKALELGGPEDPSKALNVLEVRAKSAAAALPFPCTLGGMPPKTDAFACDAACSAANIDYYQA